MKNSRQISPLEISAKLLGSYQLAEPSSPKKMTPPLLHPWLGPGMQDSGRHPCRNRPLRPQAGLGEGRGWVRISALLSPPLRWLIPPPRVTVPARPPLCRFPYSPVPALKAGAHMALRPQDPLLFP